MISFQTLRESFSSLPDSAFNNSTNSKMDDRLVFQIFDWNNVNEAIDNNSLLFPILMPSALILQVFFNKNLTRNDRYELLNVGAAIIYVQRVLLTDYSKIKNKKKGINPYNKEFMNKYLLLSASLASLFKDDKPFDLADCSSHLLEHFFGTIRRLCEGNDSRERFDSSIKKALCIRKWLSDVKIKGNIPGRTHQDKAAVVPTGKLNQKIRKKCFLEYIQIAINLIEEHIQYQISDFLIQSESIREIKAVANEKGFSDKKFEFKIPPYKKNKANTANKNIFVNISGTSNLRRFQTQTQISHLEFQNRENKENKENAKIEEKENFEKECFEEEEKLMENDDNLEHNESKEDDYLEIFPKFQGEENFEEEEFKEEEESKEDYEFQ